MPICCCRCPCSLVLFLLCFLQFSSCRSIQMMGELVGLPYQIANSFSIVSWCSSLMVLPLAFFCHLYVFIPSLWPAAIHTNEFVQIFHIFSLCTFAETDYQEKYCNHPDNTCCHGDMDGNKGNFCIDFVPIEFRIGQPILAVFLGFDIHITEH